MYNLVLNANNFFTYNYFSYHIFMCIVCYLKKKIIRIEIKKNYFIYNIINNKEFLHSL